MTRKNMRFLKNQKMILLNDGKSVHREPMCLSPEVYTPMLAFEVLVPWDMSRFYPVRLIIEYAADLENPDQTLFDVWMTGGADKVREYQHSDAVPFPCDSKDIQSKILEKLNDSIRFYKDLIEFASAKQEERTRVVEKQRKRIDRRK